MGNKKEINVKKFTLPCNKTYYLNSFFNLDDACPSPWKHFEGFCYMISRNEYFWNDASLACQGEGGNLASIHSKEENNFVKSKFLFFFNIYTKEVSGH